jgi:asparagine synthase (glutamine-hydrolysing)
MCGIYGTTINYSQSQIKEKLNRFSFRGPDYQGVKNYSYYSGQLTLGHNRLSIIDLDSRSNQPFDYSDSVSIVFNGEIYNYQDIRKSLQKKGYSFRTESDTEVICAAYLEYGKDCVQHFNGMFAFVIYDKREQLLFGARDRLGQKPLYYFLKGKEIEFCSQISGIELHHKSLNVSEESIGMYLAWRSVPDPLSIYTEVKKLKAGHIFQFSLNDGKFKETAYWDVETPLEKNFIGDYQEACLQLTALLKDAVKLRLRADVPVGVFLSGGVDSSLISALAQEINESSINTFSIKFNENKFDESEHAIAVAKHLKTNHHTILCNESEFLNLIENFTTYYDEPFADSSALPSMLLAKYTKKHVTVALTGDGGDETFLGYERFARFLQKKPYYTVPYFIRKPISTILSNTKNLNLIRLGNHLKEKNLENAYAASISTINNDWFAYDEFLNVNEKKYLKNLSDDSTLEKISNFETKTYLNWDINTKVDRATMAFSLEARSPLMDFRLVEFSKNLPVEFMYQPLNQKRILKDILYKYVPKPLIDRPKSGFAIPLNIWFKNELKELVLEELSYSNLKQIPLIKTEAVIKKINNHLSGRENNSEIIWSLLVLKKWLSKEK